MKINFKTRIRFNGKEYSSIEELPAPMRAVYEKVMANKNDSGALITSGGNGLVTTSLVFNGKTFGSPNEMPDGERELYNDVMRLVRDGAAAKGAAASLPSTASPAFPVPAPDSGWLTPNQKKLVAVVAGLILIAVLVAVRYLG